MYYVGDQVFYGISATIKFARIDFERVGILTELKKQFFVHDFIAARVD